MFGRLLIRVWQMALVVICLAISMDFAWAIGELPEGGVKGEIRILQGALNENLKEALTIQKEIKNAYRIAAHPNSEYLLYQKTLDFQDYRTKLERVLWERKKIAKRLDFLGGLTISPGNFFVGVKETKPVGILRVYSGAPMLSFYNGSHFDSGQVSRIYTGWTVLFRLILGTFLVLIFLLPLFALYRKRSEGQTLINAVRIYPIFSIQGRNGLRKIFKVVEDRSEFVYTKFGTLETYLKTK